MLDVETALTWELDDIEQALFEEIRNNPAYQRIVHRLLCTGLGPLETINALGMDRWFRLCVSLGSNLTPFETLICSFRLFLFAASLAYFAAAPSQPGN